MGADGGERLVSGWSFSTIANLLSGFPFSPQLGYNPTGSGDTRNPIRPDVNAAFLGSVYTRGTTAQRVAGYFNPNAFAAPAAGYVGDAGRDSLVGPGYADWDASLLKVDADYGAGAGTVSGGVLQCAEPHEPATAERGGVCDRADAGHDRESDRGGDAGIAGDDFGDREYEPADSAGGEGVVLSEAAAGADAEELRPRKRGRI